LIYFMQNDPSVPESLRAKWREVGLPRDEFVENGHIPYEIYMRETRRIKGRYVFTEHDARLVSGLKRAPVHGDSVSITEWFLDSHACTPAKAGGSHFEGTAMLKNKTFPGQIPYRALLPETLDNLLVPVCASSSHIGWGAIRLEPTWMSIGEAAAWATILAARDEIPPSKIDTDELVRKLADQRIMVSFFNDVEKEVEAPWYAAVQYFGTKGFFGDYDARPGEALGEAQAKLWATCLRECVEDRFAQADVTKRARKALTLEDTASAATTAARFTGLLELEVGKAGVENASVHQLLAKAGVAADDKKITRADACHLMYLLIGELREARKRAAPKLTAG
jgi:hypothetical protein